MMKETKKIRVKVKKRKLKVKNILVFLVSIFLIVIFCYYLVNIKIKNIYVINNNIVNDKEIINYSKLNGYPSYLLSPSFIIEKNLLNNPYIKEVEVVKSRFKVYLYVTEHKPLAIYENKVLLENNTLVDNSYDLKGLPVIINKIDSLEFSNYFTKIDSDVLLKISQIEYVPNEVDKDRYLLYMNDGNSVYITLTKIDKLNKYDIIVSKMEGKKGIIYLDSGDYIELK